MSAIEPAEQAPSRKFRRRIPEAHRASMDTMIQWLWHQRFGTVQTIWLASREEHRILDHTACTLIIQAILGKDLESISQLFQRLEGGPQSDKQLLDQDTSLTV